VGAVMNETERDRRSGISFTEIYHFGKIVSGFFGLGISVMICSEIYLLYSGAPRPDWLISLEGAYRGMYNVARNVASAAFDKGEGSVDPNCAVQFFQFDNNGKETGHWSYPVKTLSPTKSVFPSTNIAWQQVEAGTGSNHPLGWVNKIDFDGKESRPECK
jgi:hypothetical protein